MSHTDQFGNSFNFIGGKSNLYSTSLGLVAATLPFTLKFNLVSFYLFVVVWLLSSSASQKVIRIKEFRNEIIFVSVYLFLHLFGLLFTSNFDYGLRVIEKNLIFFVLPILIFSGQNLDQNQINNTFKFFIIGCGLAAIINLGHAVFRFLETRDFSEFYYYELAQTFGMHPVYLSEYYLFCVIILISERKDFLKSRLKHIYVLFGILMCVSIYLLESKMLYGIALLFLTIFVFSQVYERTKSYILSTGVIVLVLVLSSSSLYYSSDRIRNIMSFQHLTITREDKMNDFSKINGLTLRLLFWKYSIVEFTTNNNIFLGVGTGDVQDFLDETYENHNLAITIDGKKIGYYDYDVHNQYLDWFYRFGLVGIIYVLISFTLLISKFSSPLNEIGLFFIISLMIIFVSETFLGLNKGIVFFALFYSVFMLSIRNHSHQK